MNRDLRSLAWHLYRLARREVWLGGKKDYSNSENWPEDVEELPSNYDTWTLSPEIELGTLKMRVCVSWDGEERSSHVVRVFVDGQLKYPGGQYDYWDWHAWLWESWSSHIARIEHEDGGRTGYIECRDLLIAEAVECLSSPEVPHELPPAFEEDSDLRRVAEGEVDALDGPLPRRKSTLRE